MLGSGQHGGGGGGDSIAWIVSIDELREEGEELGDLVLRKSKAAEPGVDQAFREEVGRVVWPLERWLSMPLVSRRGSLRFVIVVLS